jgi:hypothetical protein
MLVALAKITKESSQHFLRGTKMAKDITLATRVPMQFIQPGKKAKADSPEARESRIELYASRAAAGLDIFTGAARGWQEVEGGEEEDFVSLAIARGEA